MKQAMGAQPKDDVKTPFISIPIEKEPFSEFENNPELFYVSFPHLFLLGRGLFYLQLPNDLQTEFELLDPEMHQRINRHLENRNGLVVEYNRGMSAILGCNTDFSFFGSESAARCAACYVLKYITNNPAELDSTIALVYKARVDIKNHPSKAENSGSNIRTATHFLNAVLNRINGLEEVSAQMAAAAIIGMSFDSVTHDFQLTFVTAAIAYAKR